MALSVSTGTTSGRSNDVVGTRRVTRLTVTFDSSYPEGGEAFVPATYHGSSDIDHVEAVVTAAAAARGGAGGVKVAYDSAAGTLVAYGKGTTDLWSELCACDLSALVCAVTIVGR